MSSDLLFQLRKAHAFDHVPMRHDLGVYHVPFDELLETGTYEKFLRSSAERAERTAIIGVSGSGKSSLIEHTLGPAVPKVAPIPVPVSAEPADVVTNVQSVASRLIQTLVRNSDLKESDRSRALESASSKRLVSSPKNRLDVSFGFSWMGPSMRAEVRRQAPSDLLIDRSADETLEVVVQLLTSIINDDLTPILIFDDTDKWFRSPGSDTDYYKLALNFFDDVLPVFCELPAGIVVALHSNYVANESVKESLPSSIGNRLEIPILPSAEALGKVIRSRIIAHLSPEEPSEVPELIDFLEESALERLFELHQGRFKGSLREVIRVVHTALAQACDDRYEKLTPELIDLAANTW